MDGAVLIFFCQDLQIVVSEKCFCFINYFLPGYFHPENEILKSPE